MTHTNTAVDELSDGNYVSRVVDVDITSLDNAASEDFDPVAELGFRDVFGGVVLQAENPGAYQFTVAQDNDISVQNADGTDPTAGTDVGVVRVKWQGNRGP